MLYSTNVARVTLDSIIAITAGTYTAIPMTVHYITVVAGRSSCELLDIELLVKNE